MDVQCYQFIYDSSLTPSKCDKLIEKEKELVEYKCKVVIGGEEKKDLYQNRNRISFRLPIRGI